MGHEARASLRERAIEEFKIYWIVAFYLWLFLGSFTVYRRLVVAETGTAYLHYGIAVIEALVIAKVILIGGMFGFTRRFDDRPLIVPVLYKSILFCHPRAAVRRGRAPRRRVVPQAGPGGWSTRRSPALGGYELGARVLMLFVAFVPFFAFGEIGRVLGPQKLAAMFFGKREAVQTARESR